MGEGPGFRKVRKELGVSAFGVNAIVMPPGYATGRHFHERQEELYFVHQGRIAFSFGDDGSVSLGPGDFVRVDRGDGPLAAQRVARRGGAVYVCVGGAGGYVGRDGRLPEGETSPR